MPLLWLNNDLNWMVMNPSPFHCYVKVRANLVLINLVVLEFMLSLATKMAVSMLQ